MNGFLYTLTLKEPVLTATLVGDQNSAESLFYIPGGTLRGAFIQKIGGKKDAAEDSFRRLFLSGETRFLNAYPLIDGKRTLPAPLTWQSKRKSPEKTVYRNTTCVPAGIETAGVKFNYWTLEGNKLFSIEERWQVNVHTQRDAEKGRATTENGAVYRYMALPAGMKLQGAVLTQDAADAKTLRDLFGIKAEILLGKARTAGYGAATLEITDLNGWKEYQPVTPQDGKTTLTMLSPAIVRDENGQYSLDVETALKARLGKNVIVKILACRPMKIGGFNRTWGLPLPNATAISAGSVFEVINATDGDLTKLEETGFGERRAEGFGRVAVNLDLPTDPITWEKVELDLDVPVIGSLSSNDPLAKMMLERLLRRDLDEQIVRAARKITSDYMGDDNKQTVPNSQLSRWRVIVRKALAQEDLKSVKEVYENSRGRQGWKKMEKIRIKVNGQPQRLTSWIGTVLEKPEALNETWEDDFKPERNLGPLSIQADDFNHEYRLRLLEAVLAVMSKKSGGNNG